MSTARQTPQCVQQFKRFCRDLRLLCGAEIRKDTPDRRVLEEVILPYFATLPGVHRVLWVGCEYYTKWYERIFHRQSQYWTMEILVASAHYGTRKDRHIVDGIQNISAHFAKRSLDLIFLNGVVGWGLDAPADIESAFLGCRAALSEGGGLMIGWNDEPDHIPMPWTEIKSLKDGFTPALFPPFGVVTYAVPQSSSQHHFSFYRRN